MNTTIELHDSTVVGIIREDPIVVHFVPVYLHKSEGAPGVDPGTGWVQEARLVLAGGTVNGNLPEFPCDVVDGVLVVDSQRHENSIPVPLEACAPTELKLTFGPTHSVSIRADAVRLELLGMPKYVENFGV